MAVVTQSPAKDPPSDATDDERHHEDRRDIVKGTRVTALAQLLGLAEPLLTLAVVRAYGESVWGQFLLAESLCYVGTRIACLGLDRGMLWFVSRSRVGSHPDTAGSPDEALGPYRTRGLSGALVIGMSSGAVFAAAGIALAGPVVGGLLEMPEGVTAARLTVAAVPLAVAMQVLLYALLGTRTMGPDATIRALLLPVLARAIPLALLPLSLGSVALAGSYLAAQAVALAAAVIVYRRHMSKIGATREPFAWPSREVFRYSLAVGAADLLATVMVRVDVWMIAWLMSDADVGIYGVIVSLVAVLRTLRALLDRPIVPIMGEATVRRDRARVRSLFSHATFMVTCLTGPVVVFLWAGGRELLGVYGDRFEEGAAAFSILAAGNLLYGMFGLAGHVLSGAGRGGLVLLNSVLLITINTVLNLTLIPLLGLTGAAISTACSIGGMALIEYLQARRIMGGSLMKLSTFEPLGATVACFAVALPIYFVLRSDGSDLVPRVVTMLVFIPLYGFWFVRRGLPAFRTRPAIAPATPAG
jgi:O-antigen/teichoic acid export membrane protein